MNFIDPVTIDLVGRALSATSLRHSVHATNVANVNVEGFKPSRVSFEQHLSEVRDRLGRGETLTASDLRDVRAQTEVIRDQERVELDAELATLSSNATHHQALLRLLDRQLGLVHLAITGGRP